MNVYMTEEEQIEQIKKWWQNYGNYVMTAIIIVLLAFTALRWWHNHQDRINAQASNSYEQMMLSVANHDPSGVAAQANNLRANYPNTIYAAVATLLLAKQTISQGQLKQGLTYLTWVIDHHSDTTVVQIAQIRAARVAAALHDYSAARGYLNKITDDAYQSLVYETRGDIDLAVGDKTAAVQNYNLAVKATAQVNPLLQMKLNNLL